jgi:hypothetical protein
MKLTKTLGVAGALLISALVGGTLINSASAVDEETDTDSDAGTRAAYCETFRESFAAELGVSVDELTEAGKAAAIATVDEAVEAGDLDADRAETLRERIRAHDGTCDGLGLGMGRGPGFGVGMERGEGRGIGIGLLRVAADELGMETAELRDELAELDSLRALAEARDVAYDELTAAILEEAQVRLDEAVAEGLDEQRAETMLEHITAWLEDGGQVDDLGGIGPGQGHGPGGRGGGMGPGWGNGD